MEDFSTIFPSKININIKKKHIDKIKNFQLPLIDEKDNSENKENSDNKILLSKGEIKISQKKLTWKKPNFIEIVSITSYKKNNYDNNFKNKRDSLCCNII